MGACCSTEAEPKPESYPLTRDPNPHVRVSDPSPAINVPSPAINVPSPAIIVPRQATSRVLFPTAKFIVGIDFGTTFSGFSFLILPEDGSEPKRVYTYTEWQGLSILVDFSDQPPKVASPKAPTVISYSITPEGIKNTHWGWTVDAIPPAPQIKRVERVKLLLHDQFANSIGNMYDSTTTTTAVSKSSSIGEIAPNMNGSEIGRNMIFKDLELPYGLEPKRVISDYIRMLDRVVKEQIKKHMQLEGRHFELTPDKFV
ncbi:hypothetical protein HK096_002705, partial [Nowakowskiella sp. JEL0078]